MGRAPAQWYERWRYLRLAQTARKIEEDRLPLDKLSKAQLKVKRWAYGE